MLEALKQGDMKSVAFRKFFEQCLDKSAEFKAHNKKLCKGTERYSAEKPARANVGRIAKRVRFFSKPVY